MRRSRDHALRVACPRMDAPKLLHAKDLLFVALSIEALDQNQEP
jgi:hypothetical protein